MQHKTYYEPTKKEEIVAVCLALLFVLDVRLVKEESQKEEEKNNRPVRD
jgi:hypothetical protein